MSRIRKIEILFEDKCLLVCRKPAGVPVETKKTGLQDMQSLIKTYLARKGEKPEVFVVHRLDQPVEGLMVFAKTKKAAAGLSKQLGGKTTGASKQSGGTSIEDEKSLKKEYIALVHGQPEQQKGELRNWLLKDGRTNTSRIVADKNPDAKLAILEYSLARYDEEKDISVLHINLGTGRHHQIRVQRAGMGCPIVGDAKYGRQSDMGAESELKNQLNISTLALCSCHLVFKHPETGKCLQFEIDPTFDMFGHSELNNTSQPKP